MENIILLIKRLLAERYSGDIIISLAQGGVRGIKKAKYENIEFKEPK